MTTLVVGCGSIGQRHIGNLRSLTDGAILVFDDDARRMQETVGRFDVTPCASFEDGLARRPALVLLCTPPCSHVPLARQSVAAGCHVFVEKPLGDSLDGVDELLSEAAHAGRLLWVGYNLRFHQGLRTLKDFIDHGAIGRTMTVAAEFGQFLPDWRPRQDYRAGYTARAEMGGGVILDVSHEIDYVRWLGGEIERVYCMAGKLSDLEMSAEDLAVMTVRMKGGVIGHVHLDCIQRHYVRTCKVVGESGTLVWEYGFGVRRYESGTGRWHEHPIAPAPNDMYRDELNHVLNCLEGAGVPMVDGVTGKRVLEIALAAKRSSREGREVVV